MKCEACGNELFIQGSCLRVQGDNSPEEKTEVCRLLLCACQNPKCREAGKSVEEKIVLY